MPFEHGGYAAAAASDFETNLCASSSAGAIDTLINEKRLPPVPHSYWVDRLRGSSRSLGVSASGKMNNCNGTI